LTRLHVPLARQTLLHDWRRFLPAMLAIAFSSLLVLAQVALLLGLFSTITVFVTASKGDLWVGFPGTQSVDAGRPIPGGVEVMLHRHPAVLRVERLQWAGGDWRAPRGDRGGVSVAVTGVDPQPDGMLLAGRLSAGQRRALVEPGAVILDAADLGKLGVAVGDTAEIGGRRVRVVGTTTGLRGVGAVNVVASIATAALLDPQLRQGDDVAYFVVKLRPGADPERVRDDLNAGPAPRRFEVWTARELADRTLAFWILESGLGVGVAFSSCIALLVGVAITSQTLASAVAGSIREFATLRALGVPAGCLRRIVLAQAGWLSAAGLVVAAAVGAGLVALARAFSVPISVGVGMSVAVFGLVVVIAQLSGLVALRQLRQADPGLLLR
jgi:putative ABC transport system permease protein